MVFCGQCGYQLSPGDKICPRCGAETDVDLIKHDPGTYNPTEISHAVLDYGQGSSPQNRGGQPSRPPQPDQGGPLVLGPAGSGYPGNRMADETTVMMGSQTYPPPQPAYPGYQQQTGMGMYNYAGSGYQHYQAGPTAATAQLLEASRKGKTRSLLLILFGLLLLIAAIIVFLLNQQGIIFSP